MTDRTAPTTHPVLPAIAARWSPRSYLEAPVAEAEVLSILEAGRWASSCFNDQPWHFLLARKAQEPEAHARLLACLSANNQGWAHRAPVLLLGIARNAFGHNGNPNRHALYDLGQAAATMAVQAAALGLQLHQMAGFDADKAREAFAIPEGFTPAVAITLGKPGPAEALPEALAQRETAPRARKPMADFVFAGAWGSGI